MNKNEINEKINIEKDKIKKGIIDRFKKNKKIKEEVWESDELFKNLELSQAQIDMLRLVFSLYVVEKNDLVKIALNLTGLSESGINYNIRALSGKNDNRAVKSKVNKLLGDIVDNNELKIIRKKMTNSNNSGYIYMKRKALGTFYSLDIKGNEIFKAEYSNKTKISDGELIYHKIKGAIIANRVENYTNNKVLNKFLEMSEAKQNGYIYKQYVRNILYVRFKSKSEVEREQELNFLGLSKESKRKFNDLNDLNNKKVNLYINNYNSKDIFKQIYDTQEFRNFFKIFKLAIKEKNEDMSYFLYDYKRELFEQDSEFVKPAEVFNNTVNNYFVHNGKLITEKIKDILLHLNKPIDNLRTEYNLEQRKELISNVQFYKIQRNKLIANMNNPNATIEDSIYVSAYQKAIDELEDRTKIKEYTEKLLVATADNIRAFTLSTLIDNKIHFDNIEYDHINNKYSPKITFGIIDNRDQALGHDVIYKRMFYALLYIRQLFPTDEIEPDVHFNIYTYSQTRMDLIKENLISLKTKLNNKQKEIAFNKMDNIKVINSGRKLLKITEFYLDIRDRISG